MGTGVAFLVLLIAALAAVHVPLGDYMYRVYSSAKHSRAERLVYRALPSVSVAVGMAVAIAFVRGLARRDTSELGNFWVDLVRGSLRILLPLAVLSALLLGTNGGGFFNANSAHPFENPTGWTIEGIEIVPPHYVEYRGSRYPELDVPAVLARRPEVVLVDELAHTNTPGSTNPKRWQDVEQLLAAGITVITTVNVQHLESLNDVVSQITGIEQREKVPDEVVRAADQIELADITPEALRRRLSHGNVYAPERIDAALGNYFRPGNLTALRELALLWLADQVDAALAKYRSEHKINDTWETRERVVVAVTGGPESETLVRRASRIASKASAELMVVHVVRGDGLTGISAPQMGRVRELATSLGATVHTVVGDDVPTALLDFARERNATQLVLGTSRRSRWARILDEGIGAAVVHDSGKIDVHMVTHPEESRRPGWANVRPWQRHALSWLAAAVVPPTICLIILLALDRTLGIGGESALFFIGVLTVALLGGGAPAAASAVLSGVLLNYFLVEPRHTFTIAEPDTAVTIVVLLAVAVAVAALVDDAAKRTREARRAAREAELLALFAGSVLRGADLPALLERVREVYGQRAVSLLRGGPAGATPVAVVGTDPCTRADDADTAIEVGEDEFWLLLAGRLTAARDRRVLGAVARQAAGLVQRRELVEGAAQARAIAEADELRRSLLSAVGHDLRTPLAAAKAAVSSLRGGDVGFSPEDTAELLATGSSHRSNGSTTGTPEPVSGWDFRWPAGSWKRWAAQSPSTTPPAAG